jgi:putative ABC transport system substrate-binding protein
MKRREFIAGVGSAATWPLVARAQQGERVRRIGVFLAGDVGRQTLAYSAFTQALAGLGWTDGRNVRMDLWSGGADINRIRALARELVGLQPDIILANTTPVTVAIQRETRTIPIVFVNVSDPVAIVPTDGIGCILRKRTPATARAPASSRTSGTSARSKANACAGACS